MADLNGLRRLVAAFRADLIAFAANNPDAAIADRLLMKIAPFSKALGPPIDPEDNPERFPVGRPLTSHAAGQVSLSWNKGDEAVSMIVDGSTQSMTIMHQRRSSGDFDLLAESPLPYALTVSLRKLYRDGMPTGPVITETDHSASSEMSANLIGLTKEQIEARLGFAPHTAKTKVTAAWYFTVDDEVCSIWNWVDGTGVEWCASGPIDTLKMLFGDGHVMPVEADGNYSLSAIAARMPLPNRK